MFFYTNCFRVVISPNFWKAPNSICSSKSGSTPAKTSLKIVLAPCQICPKKNNKANDKCPKVNQPRGLLLNTPSDCKVVRSNSKISPNCERRAYFFTVEASLNQDKNIP